MKHFRFRREIVAFILILGLFCTFYIILVRGKDNEYVDLAIVDNHPVVLEDGMMYEYKEEMGWIILESKEKVKQLLSGEALCFLDFSGKLHCKEISSLREDSMALGSSYVYYMAEKALALNEEQRFTLVNGYITDDFRALLKDDRIAYQDGNEYSIFLMGKKISMLSGNFILTVDGNVYNLHLKEKATYNSNSIEAELMIQPELQLLYDGGDIIYIDAVATADRCIGLTEDGQALTWSDVLAPDVSSWDNLVKVVHGFNFVAGLTEDGQVMVKHYDKVKSLEIEKDISKWENIIDIEDYFGVIYGIDNKRKIFAIEF